MCVPIELLSTYFNLPQPASTQCGVGPVCVPIELLSTYFNLPQPSVVLVQCVSPWSYCQPTSTCLNPVWCWSSVCPHGAIVNLLQPASTQCGVGPVCVPMELLSTYFNLPQPSVVLVQWVSPWSYCQPTSTCLNPVWCWSSVCPHIAIPPPPPPPPPPLVHTQGFKHQSVEVQVAAYKSWMVLMSNFSQDPGEFWYQRHCSHVTRRVCVGGCGGSHCECECMRACVHACVHACVCACVCACVRV